MRLDDRASKLGVALVALSLILSWPSQRPRRAESPAARRHADCRSAGRHPTLYSTLWRQTSAECRRERLAGVSRCARSPSGCAGGFRLDRGGGAGRQGFSGLPPAIVLDIDETVLDNSPQQARVILEGESFDPESWGEWVNEARAGPVPGRPSFWHSRIPSGSRCSTANRDAPFGPPRGETSKQPASLSIRRSTPFSRGEQEGWTSDKTSRREAIGERYRIVLLVGDDFNEFRFRTAYRVPSAIVSSNATEIDGANAGSLCRTRPTDRGRAHFTARVSSARRIGPGCGSKRSKTCGPDHGPKTSGTSKITAAGTRTRNNRSRSAPARELGNRDPPRAVGDRVKRRGHR